MSHKSTAPVVREFTAPLWCVAGALLLNLLAAAPAAAQGFGDFESAGQAIESRSAPSKLQAGGHSFEPTFNYKIFDVATPHVYGSAGLGYTDNLLRDDPEAPGLRTVRAPFGQFNAGTRLDAQLSDHRLELGYRLGVTEYTNSGEFDTLEQQARLRLDLFFTDVEGHADASWVRSQYAQSIQLRGLVKLDVFSLGGWVQISRGKFGVRLGVFWTRVDYLESQLKNQDHKSLGGDFQFYYQIFPKLRLLLEYNIGAVEFDEGRQGTLNDYIAHQIRAGVDGEVSPKLTASIKLGVALQDVDVDANPGDDSEFTGFVAQGSLSWQALLHTRIILAYSRELQVSLNSNGLETDTIQLSVTQSLYDERIQISATFGYDRSRVLPGRKINRVTAGASASYQIREWLSLVASYEFQKVNSEFPLSDYAVNTVTISLGVGF